MPYGNRKAVKKTVRWTVFRPWEIPSFREGSRYGWETGTIMQIAFETPPIWVVSFLPYGNRKAVKKTVRWTVFRPWEIPSFREGSRYGWETGRIMQMAFETPPIWVVSFLPYGNRKRGLAAKE